MNTPQYDARIMIGIFTRWEGVYYALYNYFNENEDVHLIDFTCADQGAVRSYLDKVNIAVISQDSFTDAELAAMTNELVEMNSREKFTLDTSFVALYNGENAALAYEAAERLLQKRLGVTTSRIDRSRDCKIMAQTVHGIINEILQHRRRMGEIFDDLLDNLPSMIKTSLLKN